MEETQESKDTSLEERLPVVVEILPGQATEGLIRVFTPGTYEGKTLDELTTGMLGKQTTIEEQRLIEEIQKQLEGGKLLYKGAEATGDLLEYATQQKTAAGETYLYVELRAIKPQEGG